MEKDILQIIDSGENVEIECKDAGKGLPKDLWETYSSFANTNGGTILLGVKQKCLEMREQSLNNSRAIS